MSSVPAGTAPPERRRELVNFGGNVTWQARCYRPRNEEEVLQILGRHRSERVRAIGSLHSWSDIAVTPGVTLDMSEPRRRAVRQG